MLLGQCGTCNVKCMRLETGPCKLTRGLLAAQSTHYDVVTLNRNTQFERSVGG